MSKTWKIIIFGGLGVAVIVVLVLFLIDWGNAESNRNESEVTAGQMSDLSGTYVASTDPKKREILFVANGPKSATGLFKKWTAELIIDESLEGAKLTFSIDPSSIFTDNSTRDDHLRGEDFFHVEKHGDVTFESKSIEKSGDNYVAKGTLTFLGRDWDFELPFKYRGHGEVDGKEFASFEGEFKFNQTKFGMDGGGGVGDVTEISFYVDMIKGGSAEVSEDDAWEDDEWEEEEEPSLPVREYDAELDIVEQEAESMK